MSGQQIWYTPDGLPAVELSFKFDLDGVLVRGFIDAVVVVDGGLRVRDYKTGNQPGDSFQLGVYALAIEELFGVRPSTGDYFMVGKRGQRAKLTMPYDLSEWTREAVSDVFADVEARIQAGDFDPDPEPDKCGFCDVSYSCPVYRA